MEADAEADGNTNAARSRRALAWSAVGLIALVAIVLAVLWWLDARTRPDRVGPRFADRLATRHPGVTVAGLDGGLVRVALPSGTSLDVRISRLFDRCHDSRLDCSDAIDRALDDVDHAEAATLAPTLTMLAPAVTNDGAGYVYGYVTDPLVASLEVRYAITSGLASAFVTRAIADRLGLASAGALRQAALTRLRTVKSDLEPVTESGVPVFRVRSDGDPAATLLDGDRMKQFAATIGARRLYAIVPTRDVLVIAAPSEPAARALDALRARLRGPGARTPDPGLLAYDVDAGDGQQLSIPQ